MTFKKPENGEPQFWEDIVDIEFKQVKDETGDKSKALVKAKVIVWKLEIEKDKKGSFIPYREYMLFDPVITQKIFASSALDRVIHKTVDG